MEINFDPIINVGIKYSQKLDVINIIKKSYKYKSVNHFIQEAVKEKLMRDNAWEKENSELIKWPTPKIS